MVNGTLSFSSKYFGFDWPSVEMFKNDVFRHSPGAGAEFLKNRDRANYHYHFIDTSRKGQETYFFL